MKRRTFLKSVIAMTVAPSLPQVVTGLPQVKSVPEAIYTAKTIIYDYRFALMEWLSEVIEEDMIIALSGLD